MGQGQRGASLIETLIAASIVVVVSLGASIYFVAQLNQTRRLSDVGRCSGSLASAMATLKSRGLATNAFPMSSSGGRPALPPSALAVFAREKIDLDVRRTPLAQAGQVIEFDPGQNPTVILHSPALLEGTVAAVGAIYNSDRNRFCQTAGGRQILGPGLDPSFPAINILPSRAVASLKDAVVNLSIAPYRISDGAIIGGCPDVIPRPAAAQEPAPTGGPPPQKIFTAGGANMFRFHDRFDSDVGFEVTLSARYQETTTGEMKTCQLRERFQYPVDANVAAKPIPFSTSTVPGSPFNNLVEPAETRVGQQRPQCSHGDGSTHGRFTVEFGFRSPGGGRPALEPGSVVLCRDASTVPAPVNGGWCQGGAGASMTVGASIPDTSDQRWVPCDQLRVCGNAPVASAFNFASYSADASYRMTFDSAKLWGCNVRIEYAAVDPAGNVQLADTSEMGIYFKPPPCYNCIYKKRRGFFNVQLCWIAIQVGIGQRGGCKGKSFKSCADRTGGRVRCTREDAPDPLDHLTKRPCETPVYGTFAPDAPGATYRIPEDVTRTSLPHGSLESVNYLSPSKETMCEAHYTCTDGTWTRITEEPAEPLCGRVYTKYVVNPSTGVVAASCTTMADPSETMQTTPGTLYTDSESGGTYWTHTEWYIPGFVTGANLPACVADDPPPYVPSTE